eukprot:364520-Chlamydomonas_euryale.AAC.3
MMSRNVFGTFVESTRLIQPGVVNSITPLTTSRLNGLSYILTNASFICSHIAIRGYRERTHEGYACVKRSKTEGIKQRAGRCHKGNATAHGPEPPHTTPTLPTGTSGPGAELPKLYLAKWSMACRPFHPVPPVLERTTALPQTHQASWLHVLGAGGLAGRPWATREDRAIATVQPVQTARLSVLGWYGEYLCPCNSESREHHCNKPRQGVN